MSEQEDQFSVFLEKYSEFLTETANKEDLLQFGRRLFDVTSDEHDERLSMQLLRQKEAELTGAPPPSAKKTRRFGTFRRTEMLPMVPKTLRQEQIKAEILLLQQKSASMTIHRGELEQERERMLQEYEELIHGSVDEKERLKGEIRELVLELESCIVRSRGTQKVLGTMSILPVIQELDDLNNQVLQKISGFKQAIRDALAHCERAALDRYKPKMEELLERIYENAKDLPVSEIRKRFDDASTEIEEQLEQLQAELTTETNRNDKLQQSAHKLEEKVASQRDEVLRMKKEYTQLGHEITLLNDLAVQELGSLKSQYQRLLRDQEDERSGMLSARAVVITAPRGRSKKLHRVPSKKRLTLREIENPLVPSVDEFIERERELLLAKIKRGN